MDLRLCMDNLICLSQNCSCDKKAFAWDPQTGLEIPHSSNVYLCENAAAHQGAQNGRAYSVCIGCMSRAIEHIQATENDLYGDTKWPLCKECGDFAFQDYGSIKKREYQGCFCLRKALCFDCRLEERKRTKDKSKLKAEAMRVPAGMVDESGVAVQGNVIMEASFLALKWVCECGRDIEPDASVMKCAGCGGLEDGAWDANTATKKAAEFGTRAHPWLVGD